MLLANYDWAENGVLELARQIQSEYWALVAYSLFISITAFLDVVEWKRREGTLPRGSEVTVEPEGAPVDAVEPAPGSFFATVDACQPDGAYALRNADNVLLAVHVPREQLRHRVWRTTAFVTVTNEKRHDGVTTQHVLNEQLKHWAARSAPPDAQRDTAEQLATAAAAAIAPRTDPLCDPPPPGSDPPPNPDADPPAGPCATDVAEAGTPAAPQPVPSPAVQSRRFKEWLLHFDENRFWAWLGHSDNATHFKSSGMFYYWSTVSTKLEFLKHIWISFGCPGHGKGPWDGYGAVVKTHVRNANTKGTARITTPREAAVAIERHFCSLEYEAKHASAKIQKVVVTFVEAADIPRDVRAPSYDRLVGQKSSFSCAAPPPLSPQARTRPLALALVPTCLSPPARAGTCRCGPASCSPARRATGATAVSVGGRQATA
jgi:hypothetical protein